MSRILSILLGLALAVATPASWGQAFRAYLSSEGLDSNPCTVQAPCRLLPRALEAVADGGEVWILDSANYNVGPVTVAKTVAVVAVPGAVGSFVTLGGPAMTVDSPGVYLGLRNLAFVPFPGASGGDGVRMNAGALRVDGCSFSRLQGAAVYAFGATTRISVVNSEVHGTFQGFWLRGGAYGFISNVRIDRAAAVGIYADGAVPASTVKVVASDVTISNTQTGFFAQATLANGGQAQLFVTRSTVSGSDKGVLSQGTSPSAALVTISRSAISGNDVGLAQEGTGSVLKSLGDNHVIDNVSFDTTGTITTIGTR